MPLWGGKMAPELNPAKLLWNHRDTTALANTPVENLPGRRHGVRAWNEYVRRQPTLPRGFRKYTGLFRAFLLTLLCKGHQSRSKRGTN